jgi:hypothetical protein
MTDPGDQGDDEVARARAAMVLLIGQTLAAVEAGDVAALGIAWVSPDQLRVTTTWVAMGTHCMAILGAVTELGQKIGERLRRFKRPGIVSDQEVAEHDDEEGDDDDDEGSVH